MKWFWSLVLSSSPLLWIKPVAPIVAACEDPPREPPDADDLSVW